MNEIVVIDYGVGNLLSVKRGLEYCGVKAIITSKPEDIINATKIILPGVGAFKNAMQWRAMARVRDSIIVRGDSAAYIYRQCYGAQWHGDTCVRWYNNARGECGMHARQCNSAHVRAAGLWCAAARRHVCAAVQ